MPCRKRLLFVSIFCVITMISDRETKAVSEQRDPVPVPVQKSVQSEPGDNYITGDVYEKVKLTKWFWDFTWNNSKDWNIHDAINGGIIGGAILITINPDESTLKKTSWRKQVWGPNLKHDLESPVGLDIPAEKYNKVVLRIRNLSPETDGLVFWRTVENPDKDAGQVRFIMKPDCAEWQEVVCHMDSAWTGTIHQIRIRPARLWWRGDIWIDWIAVTHGEPKEIKARPDLCSDHVVPVIVLPGISQESFTDAFKVLDECLVTDVPLNGFTYPFLAPGGAYGQNWWQLDASLNSAGAKWVNQELVEDMMRGFADVQKQNPDGRIDLWGGSPVRGQAADVSSIPRYFEAAYDVARRTDDLQLQEIILETMKKYLYYWLSPVKRDDKTGLITAVFEETFSEPHADPGIVAAVDLNVAVAIGCYNTSQLAEMVDHIPESQYYARIFKELCQSINRYLWNEKENVYYNYNVPEGKHHPRLLCTTFDPMQLGIVPLEHVDRLITKLLDPALFNWGIRPVTTIARTEPDYQEAVGPYDGTAWYGDVWTMRNLPIISGLERVGRHDLAAELIWATITTFDSNYSEYIVPSTGAGEGVERYGWTASQYIQVIIEHLFGIDYDRFQQRLRILPHVPAALEGQKMSITDLIIPSKEDTRLSLSIEQTERGEATIDINLTGQLPAGYMDVYLPVNGKKQVQIKNEKGEQLPVIRDTYDLSNVAGVRLPVTRSVRLLFKTF